MLFALRLHRPVPDRRPRRRVPGRRALRLPRPGHLLGRLAPPLRARRRLRLRASSPALFYWFPKMTGRKLNERLGKVQFCAAVHRHQPGLLPAAPAGPGRHGPAHRRLRRQPRLDGAQLPLDDRRVHDRRVSVLPFLWNVFITLREPRNAPRRPVGRLHARVGDHQPAAAVQLRLAAADPLRAAAVRPQARRRCRRTPWHCRPAPGDDARRDSRRCAGGGAASRERTRRADEATDDAKQPKKRRRSDRRQRRRCWRRTPRKTARAGRGPRSQGGIEHRAAGHAAVHRQRAHVLRRRCSAPTSMPAQRHWPPASRGRRQGVETSSSPASRCRSS